MVMTMVMMTVMMKMTMIMISPDLLVQIFKVQLF